MEEIKKKAGRPKGSKNKYKVVRNKYIYAGKHIREPFSKGEFDGCLDELEISRREAAKLLSVDPRTLARWAANPHEISGPAEQALRSWLRLKRYYLPWHPDSMPIYEDPAFPYRIAVARNDVIGLNDIIKRVREKGGSKLPWKIDIRNDWIEGIARLETINIRFRVLANGQFSPLTYAREGKKTTQLDFENDAAIFEDGIYAIHQKVSLKIK